MSQSVRRGRRNLCRAATITGACRASPISRHVQPPARPAQPRGSDMARLRRSAVGTHTPAAARRDAGLVAGVLATCRTMPAASRETGVGVAARAEVGAPQDASGAPHWRSGDTPWRNPRAAWAPYPRTCVARCGL